MADKNSFIPGVEEFLGSIALLWGVLGTQVHINILRDVKERPPKIVMWILNCVRVCVHYVCECVHELCV